jgi:glycosyltransferase involved in cell wall biosynthesis
MHAAIPSALDQDDRLTFVRKRGLRDFAAIRAHLRKVEQNTAPDVVFTVFGPPYFRASARHVVGFANPHVIYPPHELMTLRMRVKLMVLDRVYGHVLRKVDHLVVETGTVRERLSRRFGVNTSKISVICNSLNPMLARREATPAPPRGPFVLLIPSAYYPHKNLEILPPVAAALKRLDPGFEFGFRVTLDPNSRPWRAIERSATRLGIRDRLVTLGTLPLGELATAYQTASAVFLPTLREASTAVYPESFHFRRPLITSNLDFARELCGNAALLVPPFEPETIARMILELARNDSLAERLVESGAQRLLTNYPPAGVKFAQQIEVLRAVSGYARHALALPRRVNIDHALM